MLQSSEGRTIFNPSQLCLNLPNRDGPEGTVHHWSRIPPLGALPRSAEHPVLVARYEPRHSPLGIGWTLVTAFVMFALAFVSGSSTPSGAVGRYVTDINTVVNEELGEVSPETGGVLNTDRLGPAADHPARPAPHTRHASSTGHSGRQEGFCSGRTHRARRSHSTVTATSCPLARPTPQLPRWSMDRKTGPTKRCCGRCHGQRGSCPVPHPCRSAHRLGGIGSRRHSRTR